MQRVLVRQKQSPKQGLVRHVHAQTCCCSSHKSRTHQVPENDVHRLVRESQHARQVGICETSMFSQHAQGLPEKHTGSCQHITQAATDTRYNQGARNWQGNVLGMLP